MSSCDVCEAQIIFDDECIYCNGESDEDGNFGIAEGATISLVNGSLYVNDKVFVLEHPPADKFTIHTNADEPCIEWKNNGENVKTPISELKGYWR